MSRHGRDTPSRSKIQLSTDESQTFHNDKLSAVPPRRLLAQQNETYANNDEVDTRYTRRKATSIRDTKSICWIENLLTTSV